MKLHDINDDMLHIRRYDDLRNTHRCNCFLMMLNSAMHITLRYITCRRFRSHDIDNETYLIYT